MAIKPSRVWMENARKKLQKEELRRTGGTPEDASYHSKSYHKAFDGYVEVKRVTESGRTTIQRIYAGDYYEPDEPKCRRITRRVLYCVLHLAAILSVFFGATAQTAVNFSVFVAVFHVALFPALLWESYVLLFYVLETGAMTVGDYKSLHRPLIRSSFLTALLSCANVAAILCVGLAFRESFRELLPALLPAVCSATATFAMGNSEKRLTYRVRPSGAEIPPDAAPITSNDVSHF